MAIAQLVQQRFKEDTKGVSDTIKYADTKEGTENHQPSIPTAVIVISSIIFIFVVQIFIFCDILVQEMLSLVILSHTKLLGSETNKLFFCQLFLYN